MARGRLREFWVDAKQVAIVVVCAIAFFLWLITLYAFFFINALIALCWIPLPLIVGIVYRLYDERGEKKKSDVDKAQREIAKTKPI